MLIAETVLAGIAILPGAAAFRSFTETVPIIVLQRSGQVIAVFRALRLINLVNWESYGSQEGNALVSNMNVISSTS
jgi:hypothetical protein